MRPPSTCTELPAEFVLESTPRAWLAVHVRERERLRHAGYGPESDGALAESAHRGRKVLFEIRAPAGTLLVRRFSHGGLLRFLTGSRFLEPDRPFHELRISYALARRGIRTPEVVAARAQGLRGGGYRLDVITRQIDDALDLGRLFGAWQRGELAPRSARALARALGGFVRELHAAGCLHADLTLNNVLVRRSSLESAQPELWILDLDRAALLPSLSVEQKRASLMRLWRFVERRSAGSERRLERTQIVRFFRAYDPSRAAWRADCRAVHSAFQRVRGLHSAGWLLDKVFGSRSDPRFDRGASASVTREPPRA